MCHCTHVVEDKRRGGGSPFHSSGPRDKAQVIVPGSASFPHLFNHTTCLQTRFYNLNLDFNFLITLGSVFRLAVLTLALLVLFVDSHIHATFVVSRCTH